jgi:hypothetical protein
MSWYVTIPSTRAEDFSEVVASLTLPEEKPSPEALEQLAAAKAAVTSMFQSGAYGPLEGISYGGGLSGHANPNHEPREGWSNDTGAVNIYRW